VIRAAAVAAGVFAMAALFSMELRQAVFLSVVSGAMAWVLEKARG
jgi:hypothetical protein